jgi:hypothetical protein
MSITGYPQINGQFYQYSNLSFSAGGIPSLLAVQEISYGDENQVEDIYGMSRQKLGTTDGQEKPHGSFTMYQLQLRLWLAALIGLQAAIKIASGLGVITAGFGDIPFVMNIAFGNALSAAITDKIAVNKIVKVDNQFSEGPKGLIAKVDLNVQAIKWGLPGGGSVQMSSTQLPGLPF